MYSPFDFNEAIGHKKEYIEDNLREGSPVVGLAYQGGLLLLTLRRTQRKVYEIYDRQMFSAIGKQADIENIRLSSIQYTHQEGFERSPDDVSIQRLAGFYLSPALKKAFGDAWTSPFIIGVVCRGGTHCRERYVFHDELRRRIPAVSARGSDCRNPNSRRSECWSNWAKARNDCRVKRRSNWRWRHGHSERGKHWSVELAIVMMRMKSIIRSRD